VIRLASGPFSPSLFFIIPLYNLYLILVFFFSLFQKRSNPPVIMQLKFAFITTALLVSASPAMSAIVEFFEGAGCTGSVIGTANGGGGECIWVINGGSARSISYSGANSIQFFISGGGHDQCRNGSQLTLSGSGCSTAPDG
jgi:hypothetical protein